MLLIQTFSVLSMIASLTLMNVGTKSKHQMSPCSTGMKIQHIFKIHRSLKIYHQNLRKLNRYLARSEERRVGKECRARWSPDREKKTQVRRAGCRMSDVDRHGTS